MRKKCDSPIRLLRALKWCGFVAATIVMSHGSVSALEVFVMRDAPNLQTAPAMTRYSSVSNFRSNTSGTTTARGIGQGSSCDFTIVNGAVFLITGDASATGDKEIFTWPSVADWAANTNGSSPGTRLGAAPMSGMAIYQNELYILEGTMNSGGTKTLRRWSSIASWVSGAAGTEVGQRLVSSGIGFDIDTDGVVYFLDTTGVSPNTATTGTIYSWPTISNFLANTSTNDNGGTFTFFTGSPNEIAGLAVVPEPSTWILAGIAALAVPVISRNRRRKVRSS